MWIIKKKKNSWKHRVSMTQIFQILNQVVKSNTLNSLTFLKIKSNTIFS